MKMAAAPKKAAPKPQSNNNRFVPTFDIEEQMMNQGMHTLNEYKGVVVIDVKGFNNPFVGKLYTAFLKTKKKECR